jgi:phospholipid/cholesterol/gamma-HCH transport system substrate-binding protein
VDKDHRAAVRAGRFIIGAVVVAAVVFVVLGNANRLFDRSAEYTVHFTDVDGLKVDSPVRLGGLTVGSVKEIAFAGTLGDTRVLVKLKVGKEFASRVRSDSIARIGSRGLLGDKTVDITVGSDEGKAIESGAELVAGVGGDISSILRASSEVVGNVVTISTDVRKAIASFTSPELRGELTGAVTSLHDILAEVSGGKGALHRVIYDEQTGTDLSALLANATQVAHRLDAAVLKVDDLLGEVEHGSGTAHSLLYGPEGREALAELGKTATEVTGLIRDVKASKNAAAHELLFGESRALVDDLSTSATNLKNITAKVEKGEGSLGALINDPTAYEDLKTILGNVKRNRILRELVRMTVSNRSEYEDTGKVLTPPAAEDPGKAQAPAEVPPK